jgi:Ca2+-binding EF-hand superfamily protein
MTSSYLIVFAAGLAFSAGTAQSALAQSKIEIQQMDRNGDGVVTRAEWQGPEGAFRLHDTNKDGVLSGTEVWDSDRGRDRRGPFNDWTPRAFADLDRNRDGRITWKEWRFDRVSFELADRNRDNVITRGEFLSVARQSDNRGDRFGNRFDRFRELDLNNDGAISRNEWNGNDLEFRTLDRNRDNFITRDEYREVAGTSGRNDTFGRSDNAYRAGNAYMAGYERGWAEGKAAGREDRDRNQGWDIEGQRELEQADSGYDPRFGSRPQYQEGYRDGFRAAYPEGWDRR